LKRELFSKTFFLIVFFLIVFLRLQNIYQNYLILILRTKRSEKVLKIKMILNTNFLVLTERYIVHSSPEENLAIFKEQGLGVYEIH